MSSDVEFELIDGRELADHRDPPRSSPRATADRSAPTGSSGSTSRGRGGRPEPIVARDAGGPLGVVFGLPWRFRVDGTPVDGIRLVDGATTPRAVRRGVFRRIVRELIDPTDGSPRPPIVIATATPEAQGAHVKNGAVAVEPIDSSYRPTAYSRAELETGPSVLDDDVQDPIPERRDDGVGCAHRCDGAPVPSSGATYHMARLAHGDADNGVIYRLGPRRTLILTARWGPDRERTTLLRAVARRHRAIAVLGSRRSRDARADPATRAPSWTVLAVRLGSHGAGATRVDLGDRAAWKLSGLDLEGYI